MLHSALHPGFSAAIGTGVIAVRDIPMGTMVWGPCANCRTWDTEAIRATPRQVVDWLDEYGYRLADRSLLLPCGGAHLLNHSCTASVLDHGLTGGITVRDIAAGEEVTCDYRTFRHDDPWEFRCACGSPDCLGAVRSGTGPVPVEVVQEWAARMKPALAVASTIVQEIPVRSGSVVEVCRGGNRDLEKGT